MTARTETTTTQPEGAAAPAATEAIGSTASLLADLRGSDRSEGAIPVTKHRRRLSGLSIITLFVIASSAAALWGMRYYGTRAGMKLDKISFELTPEADDTLAKTIIQIFSQYALGDGIGRLAVGCSDQPSIDGGSNLTADAHNLIRFERAQ